MKKENTKQNALFLSTDEQMFRRSSEPALRMKAYGQLMGEIHIIVFSKLNRGIVKIGRNVWVYSTKSANRLMALIDGQDLGGFLISRNQINMIFAQDAFTTGFIGLLLARKNKCKLVVGVYGSAIYDSRWVSESLKHRVYRVVGNEIMKRAHAIQTDGPETIERLTEKYGDKVFFKPMIPKNIVDFMHISRDRNKDLLRVLYIGRLVPQKNTPLLVGVMSKTVEALKDKVTFTVVGTGPDRAQLLSDIKNRNINKFVNYKARVEHDDMRSLYASHDVLIMTSHYEGFPRVFMEAAASGMPIITTKVGGIKDLVVDGATGYVLNPEAGSFLEKLQILAEHRETLEDLSRNIKKTFKEKYGDKNVLFYQEKLIDFLTL